MANKIQIKRRVGGSGDLGALDVGELGVNIDDNNKLYVGTSAGNKLTALPTSGGTLTGDVSTSGNISTSGDGTITSASSLTAGGTLYVDENIRHSGDTNNYINFTTDTQKFYTDNTLALTIDSSQTVTVGGNLTVGGSCTLAAISGTSATFSGSVSLYNGSNLAGRFEVDSGLDTYINSYGSGNFIKFKQNNADILTLFETFIAIPDSKELRFGDGSDLRIRHNGTDSYIDDVGTGRLLIRSNHVRIGKYTGEEMIDAYADGAVKLYHDNVVRLETTVKGINLDGGVDSATLDMTKTADTAERAIRIQNSSTSFFVGVEAASSGNRFVGSASNNAFIGTTSADDGLEFATANNVRGVVTAGGNWGLGTNSPAVKLDVYGSLNLRSEYNLTWGGTAGANIPLIYGKVGSGGHLAFHSQGTDKESMRIDHNNNIGIGVVPATDWDENHDAIQLGLTAALVSGGAATGWTQLMKNGRYVGSGTYEYLTTDEASRYIQKNDGTHHFDVAVSGNANTAITFNTALSILNNGSVGIGTVSPGNWKLYVNGDGYIDGDAAISGGLEGTTATFSGNLTVAGSCTFAALSGTTAAFSGDITLTGTRAINNSTSAGVLTLQGGASWPGGKIVLGGGNAAGGDIKFYSGLSTESPNEMMSVLATGHVKINNKLGVGLTPSSAKLEVKGDGGGTGLTFKTTDSANNNTFWIQDGGKTGLHYYPFVINQDSGDTDCPASSFFYIHHASAPFVVKNDGKVGIATSSPDYKLHVAGDYIFTDIGKGLRLGGSSHQVVREDTDELRVKAATASGYTTFYTGSGGETMRLNADGKLGLGVTPESWNALFDVLQIGVSGALTGRKSDSLNQTDVMNNVYYDGAFKRINDGYATRFTQSNSGEFEFWSAGTANADVEISGGNGFTKSLAIGANGGATFTSDSDVWAAEINQSNTSNGDGLKINTGSTASSEYALSVRSNNVNRFDVKSNGYVGVNAASPIGMLNVRGADQVKQLVIANSTSESGTFDNETGIWFKGHSSPQDERCKAAIFHKCTGDYGVGDLVFAIDGGANNDNAVLADEKLRITAGGLVRHKDSVKSVFGDSDDLEIYHDGSNSYIKDTGTGSLVLATSKLFVNNAASNEEMISAAENGAVELFYDNSKKLETSSTGVSITGGVSTTASSSFGGSVTAPSITLSSYLNVTGTGDSATFSGNIKFNTPSDPRLYAGSGVGVNIDGEHLYLNRYASNKDVRMVGGGGNVIIGSNAASSGKSLEVYKTGHDTGVMIHAYGGTNGTTQAGLWFRTDNSSAATYGRAKGAIIFQRTGSYGVGKMFFCMNGDGTNPSAAIADAKMALAHGGQLGIGTTSPGAMLDVRGASGYLKFDTSAADGTIKSDYNLKLYADDTGDNSSGYQNIQFYTAGANERARITHDGKIGIGLDYTVTTAPVSLLHVQQYASGNYTGEVRIGGSNADHGILMSYTQLGATEGSIHLAPSYANSSAALKLRSSTNNTNQLVLTGNGRVGINTPAPSSLLTLRATEGGAEDIFAIKADDDGNLYRVGKDSNDHGYVELFDGASTPIKVRLNSSGSSYFNGGGLAIGSTDPGSYKLYVNGTTMLKGDTEVDGAIGVGDAPAAGYKLYVNGHSRLMGHTDVAVNSNTNLRVNGATHAGETWDGAIHIKKSSTIGNETSDEVVLYAEDVTEGGVTNCELRVMDDDRNRTTLSSHINGKWVYKSDNTKTGKSVKIHMEDLVKAVEEHLGMSFSEIVEGSE